VNEAQVIIFRNFGCQPESCVGRVNPHCFTCGCGAGAGWEILHVGKWVLSQSTWT